MLAGSQLLRDDWSLAEWCEGQLEFAINSSAKNAVRYFMDKASIVIINCFFEKGL